MYLENDECKVSVSNATLDNYIHIRGIVYRVIAQLATNIFPSIVK